MTPLAEAARRVVLRAGLMRFLGEIAEPLELTPADARDLALLVLVDDKADDAQRDEFDKMRPWCT